MSERDVRVDNIKGGLILLVIFGHLIEPMLDYMPVLSRIYNFIYLFHIPAFVLVSGYLSNPDKPLKYSSLLKTVVVPFIIFSTLYEASDRIASGEFSSYLKSLSPNWILWFLFSLLLWRVFTPLFLKIRFVLPLLIILSVAISLFDINGYTLSLLRTVVFFPFYILGAMLGKYKNAFYDIEIKPTWCLGAALTLLGLFSLNLPFDRAMLYGSAPFPALGYSGENGALLRLCYYPAAMLALFAFAILASKITLLSKPGSNSLYVYLLHGLVVKYLIWPWLAAQEWSASKVIALALLLTLALSAFLSSRLVTRGTARVINACQSLLVKEKEFA
ncbi:acyltransferase family protein [Paramixta manurensis]|uniref:Acyltransferase family protein n=1 Tax=Paramixta manurensis TaxID=2740817 RepID=A0A6M8UBK4_9GAMM|nr:acyltransferase family protein [Erwiniaceae bacterium PD-1]